MYIKTNKFANDIINTVRLTLLDSGYASSGPEWNGNYADPPYSRFYYII